MTWRHQMEPFSALLALCARNSPVTGEFPSQRPVTRSFDVFFDLRLNKRLSKQSWGWCFETPPLSLWRHCNGHWSYSTVRKYSKPCLRTLGRDPRDTLPCVHSSFDWRTDLQEKKIAVGRDSWSVNSGPSRMFSVLTEMCRVGYSR